MGYTRRYVSFDLYDDKTKEGLRAAGYSDDTSKAYKDIRKYMQKNGFEWNQKSGYISKEPIAKADVVEIIARITEEIPYLKGAFARVKNIPANLEEYASIANNGLTEFDKITEEANSIVEDKEKIKEKSTKKADSKSDEPGYFD